MRKTAILLVLFAILSSACASGFMSGGYQGRNWGIVGTVVNHGAVAGPMYPGPGYAGPMPTCSYPEVVSKTRCNYFGCWQVPVTIQRYSPCFGY